ncbi:MAG TPA: TRAP transporter small permease [Geminicoccaceae bacterium]|nr:TRAP transporter small permease [Geminicoccaceae bacterium]
MRPAVEAAAPTEARPVAAPLLSRLLANLEEAVAGAALVIVVLAVCWGVLSRYVTAQPAPWEGEIAGIGFAWVVVLGAAAGFKRGLHVSIDLLVRRLPDALRVPLAWIVDLLVLAFVAYVTWLAVHFTMNNWTNPTPVLRLPFSVTYAALALGFLSITLRHAAALLARLLGRPVRPGP